MSNVLPYPVRNYLQIESGTVTASGDASKVGTFRYFIELVENGGEPDCIWDGETYETAQREAAELSKGLSLPVFDMIEGGTA